MLPALTVLLLLQELAQDVVGNVNGDIARRLFACGTNRMKKIPLPIVITSVYGIIDEIHQSFTPGRECSFFDWVADTLGAVFGSICFVLVFCAVKAILVKLRKN